MVSNSALRARMKVVCVNAEPEPGRMWSGDDPTLNAVYTIKSIFSSPATGRPVVTLNELPRNTRRYPGFLASRFRPAIEPKTEAEDVAVFRGLLDVPSDTKLGMLEELLNQ